jgi:streptogramin lyase
MTFAPFAVPSPDVTVNAGPSVATGLVPVTVPIQPVTLPSGIIQPQPPPTGFSFPGASNVYPLSELGNSTYWCCAGRDGNIWFAEASDTLGSVWRVTPAGVATEFEIGAPLGVDGVVAAQICSGPDGNLWVTGTTAVYQVTTDGAVTAFTVGTSLTGICSGSDGNLWAADQGAGGIWQITTSGDSTFFSLAVEGANAICAGPDGNLWVVGTLTDQTVFVVSTSGDLLQTIDLGVIGVNMAAICSGPDGRVWTTGYRGGSPNDGYIFAITPDGAVTTFTVTNDDGGDDRGPELTGIATGAGGDLWVTDQFDFLWKCTIDGKLTAFSAPDDLIGICSGPDGSLWVAGYNGHAVAFPFIIQAPAINLTQGDLTFDSNGQGPVVTDQADGHTYRIISTAGALSTQMVT